MKEYMLLIRNEIDQTSQLSEEKHQQFLKDCMIYIEGLLKEKKLKEAQPLVKEGIIISKSGDAWKDGPFNETKEVIVGYYHVVVKNLAEAISIAKQNPEFVYTKTARIEIREIKTKEESTKYVYPS